MSVTDRLERTYRPVLFSKIPVSMYNGRYFAPKLWAVDLNAQADLIDTILLICPVEKVLVVEAESLDERIQIIDSKEISTRFLDALIAAADVVEVQGNYDWVRSALERRAVRLARKHQKLSVLAISSNRAKTTIMNAEGRPILSRLRAKAKAASIKFSCRYLAARCDAVRVVGAGLKPLVEDVAKTLLVETASWISSKDIAPQREASADTIFAATASRLEPMKGVDIGINAAAILVAADKDIRLTIIGEGADEARLRGLVSERALNDRAEFVGQLGYPEPFYSSLRRTDYVLLTNRNDEQPRLIFDAVAQGAIPICPMNKAYENLGLDQRLFYQQGCPTSLADTWRKLIEAPEEDRGAIRRSLRMLAEKFTIETMHNRRRDWVHERLAA